MVKRRTTIIGLGALATGSGAVFTSASLNNVASTNTASLDVYAARELNVKRGDDSEFDNSGFTIDNPSELPQANVQGNTQEGTLEIETAVRNSSSTKEFNYLLEIENNSTGEVNVGFGIGSFNQTFLDDENVSTTTDELLDMHTFEVNASESSGGFSPSDEQDISPTSSSGGATTPATYQSIPSGETLAVNLDIDPTGSIVSDINSFVDIGSGDPFEDGQTSDVTLIDEIQVGTENASF